ncbi:MAG TPA: endonuclease/exonuclease/phosphatase family protein, partial [Candidatus Saccharimonadia bacterium]|nr:endonuclease/exonuclease/phosphatase family protein [Candidatus Saccharimonadia bacterium]
MEFSVLQWNIWYQEDARRVAAFLKAHPADVVCLQELTKGVPERIADVLGYEMHYHNCPIEDPGGSLSVFANGIFSRFPMVERTWFWTNEPQHGGGYDDEYRAYVQAVVDIDGVGVSVGTTHMSYTHQFERTTRKQAETARLMTALGARPRRHIFAGDLNALPGSDTINSLERVMRQAGPDYHHKTWTTKPFSYRGFEADSLDYRLDYVFVSPDIEVVSTEVLKTDLSDHLPI